MNSKTQNIPLEKITNWKWRIPSTYKAGMRVDGYLYASEEMLKAIQRDRALEQVANVAHLPGIVGASLAMPDIHWGYGFPIGGVCATDLKEQGVVSPGGIGFDINCGVRLLRTDLEEKDLMPQIDRLATVLFQHIPSGVGSHGKIRLGPAEMKKVLRQGAGWAVHRGLGEPEDLEATEERGAFEDPDADGVSERARDRGRNQLGTLGSGNHFVEVQVVDQVFDEKTAYRLGLHRGQATLMIHTGSRGLGYQVCDDFLKTMLHCLTRYDIHVPDRQLACAPIDSPEGRAYLGAMRCAANYAWANRQCLTQQAREAFEKVFRGSWQSLGLSLVYDVAHNIAKIEDHEIDGIRKRVCVHRKGATRAFGPGNRYLPQQYRDLGQPVIIPGDMGRHSYLLLGQGGAEDETFGTTCHGAGRVLSRAAARRDQRSRSLFQDLQHQGIRVMVRAKGLLVEEAPWAYKDVNEVVDVVHQAGISKRVCRMRPIAVVKG